MQCFKCRNEIAENERFCSHCGTDRDKSFRQQSIDDSIGFLDFIRRVFRGYIAFILIADIVVLGIVGGALGGAVNGEYAVLGTFLGLIIGFLLVVLGGGVLVTFIEIGDNIRRLKDDLDEIKKSISK
ncbi:MAG: zinc ribbon domain-containing protein [Candidatus Cloacimonetes bacterium]|nr:zinc ribbon domain-containing protein [Candidatus Cloacimonadota bacterium]